MTMTKTKTKTTTTASAQIEGEYHLKVSSPRGDREYRFKNLILNTGLDQLFAGAVIGHVQIGTSNVPPVVTDTALLARVASTSNVSVSPASAYTAGPPDYITMSVTYRFAPGALNGNFSEIGIGWASTGSLFSRALITNSGGSPISLTVLTDEQLDVTYLVRVYPQQADATGTITLDGVSYAYTLRPARVNQTNLTVGWRMAELFAVGLPLNGATMNSYTGTIDTRTSAPGAGSGDAATTNAALAYTAGSFQRTYQYTANLTEMNAAGGIKSVTIARTQGGGFGAVSHQIEFNPVIPKDGTKRLRLDIRYSFTRRP